MSAKEDHNFSEQTSSRYSGPALFCIGFAVLYLKVFLDSTTLISLPPDLSSMLFIEGVVFLLLHMAYNLGKYKRIIRVMPVAIAFGVWLYFRTGETSPLIAILVVVAGATTKGPKWLVRFWLTITVFLVGFLCIAYVVVMLLDPDSLVLIYRKENGYIAATRYAFFFTHPNSAAAVTTMIICAYLYLKDTRITVVTVIILTIVALIVYHFTDSRTSIILSLLAVVVFCAQQHTGFLSQRIVKNCLSLLPVIMLILTYLLADVFYSYELGSMFTERVWLWHTSNDSQGLTVLGQAYRESQAVNLAGYLGTASRLDSFYANGLYVFGLVFSALFSYVYFATIQAEHDPYSQTYSLLLIMALFGFTEGKVIVLLFSPGLLLFSNTVASALGERHPDKSIYKRVYRYRQGSNNAQLMLYSRKPN